MLPRAYKIDVMKETISMAPKFEEKGHLITLLINLPT